MNITRAKLSSTVLLLVFLVCQIFLVCQSSSNASPPLKPRPKSTLTVAVRVPLPLRQLLYRSFMSAIQKADDVTERKYPTPRGFVSNHADFVRYMKIRSNYVNQLTNKYTAQIRHEYKISVHEEDLIENEGIAKSWPD